MPTAPSLPRPPRRLRRTVSTVILSALLIVSGFGALTYRHAWSMTHYAPSTTATTRAAQIRGFRLLEIVATGPTVRRQSNKRTPGDLGLPFETLRFPGAHGLQLEAWRIPSRQPTRAVLMFPGYGGSKDTLLPAAREFTALGWEVWMIDPHGIGGSEGTTTSVGWHEADDVAAAFRQFRKRSAMPCVLYGTSMGAVAILRAMHRGTVTPDALILECPFDRFTHAIGSGYDRLHLPGWLLGPATAFWVGAQQGFNGFAHNPAEYVRSVHCPTLLLQGELDETVGRSHVREVGRHLRPDCTFAFLPGAGHAHLVTRSAGPWKDNVHAFIARLSIPQNRRQPHRGAQYPGKAKMHSPRLERGTF